MDARVRANARRGCARPRRSRCAECYGTWWPRSRAIDENRQPRPSRCPCRASPMDARVRANALSGCARPRRSARSRGGGGGDETAGGARGRWRVAFMICILARTRTKRGWLWSTAALFDIIRLEGTCADLAMARLRAVGQRTARDGECGDQAFQRTGRASLSQGPAAAPQILRASQPDADPTPFSYVHGTDKATSALDHQPRARS